MKLESCEELGVKHKRGELRGEEQAELRGEGSVLDRVFSSQVFLES